MTKTMNQSINQLKPLSYAVDTDSKISIGGLKVEDLIAQYGSPLYLVCEDTIRERARAYEQAFAEHYPEHLVIYASKAFNCQEMCRIIATEQLGLDVVSGAELYTALAVNFDPARIIFHGNNKSREELELALAHGVTIVLDNRYELQMIEEIMASKKISQPNRGLCDEMNTDVNERLANLSKVSLLIRITPGIECHTHEYIKTGKIDSKFGFDINELDEIITRLKDLQSKSETELELRGLHAHIGSQIFETIPHRDTVEVLVKLYAEIQDKHDLKFADLNVGGGLGIKYQESDDPPEIETMVKTITDALNEFCPKYGVDKPRVMVEPGRSIAGPAGMTVYKVGNIKNIPGVRKYVAVDGGMADNVRPIMYQAVYQAEIDGQALSPEASEQDIANYNAGLEKVTVAGKYCESGDILIQEAQLPEIEHGDTLAIFSTGAYNYSMASNYNRATKPPVVMVKDGESKVIIKGESYDDLLQHDV